jgi:tetratricopeptide (TPR) repeat protein
MENDRIKELTASCSEYLNNADFYNAMKCSEETLELSLGLYGEYARELIEPYGTAGLCHSLYAFRTAGNEQLGEERFIASDSSFAKSLYYYSMALDITKALYGEESTQAARIYTNMGSVYRLMDDDWQEEEYYMQAVTIYSGLIDEVAEKYGEFSPQLADIYENLSMLYKNMECTKEMLLYIEKAEKIYEKTEHGHEHNHSEDECECHEHENCHCDDKE